MPSSDFSKNLRYLTAESGTSAMLCRRLGLNQQQFSKYLNDRSRPSAHTLRKLARFFELDDEDMLKPHPDFLALERRRERARTGASQDPLADAFPGDLARLRPYLGAYQTYYTSPAAPGMIVRAAAFLDERSGMVLSRTVETSRPPAGTRRQWTRCKGKAAYFGERIFVIDYEAQNGGSFMMTTLMPPHRRRKGQLLGVASFLASHPRRMPFTSRIVWKRFEPYRTVRELLQQCDFVPKGSRSIDPAIRAYLEGSDELSHALTAPDTL